MPPKPAYIRQVLLLCSCITIFTTIGIVAGQVYCYFYPYIYPDVYVSTLNVGGLSEAEAEAALEQQFNQQCQQPLLILTYGDKQWALQREDISAQIDAAQMAHNAYLFGREGSVWERILSWSKLIHDNRVDTPYSIRVNQKQLQNQVQQIAAEVNKKASNATIIRKNNSLEFVPETVGVKIQPDQLLQLVFEQLSRQPGQTVAIPVQTILPDVRLADIEGMREISSFTTSFDPSDANRSDNVLLAARMLNGTLVRPRQLFSFNQTVGPRLAENGYKNAPVYENGNLIPGIGGGVCQVSSTLYNAVLLANLEIVERSPHYHPPGYVPLGFDATVADNLIDFKFKNNADTPLLITCELGRSKVTTYLYGFNSDPSLQVHLMTSQKIRLDPNTIIKQDPHLATGIEEVVVPGTAGYKVSITRVITKGNQEVSRELISEDEFRPVDRVIRVGTANQPLSK